MTDHNTYYTLNLLSDQNAVVMSMDFDSHFDAIRENVEWRKEGIETELLELSTSPIFDSVGDEDSIFPERLAY